MDEVKRIREKLDYRINFQRNQAKDHRNRGGARSGAERATAPASGNLSPPVGGKLTIRRGIFAELIYILYKLSTCY